MISHSFIYLNHMVSGIKKLAHLVDKKNWVLWFVQFMLLNDQHNYIFSRPIISDTDSTIFCKSEPENRLVNNIITMYPLMNFRLFLGFSDFVIINVVRGILMESIVLCGIVNHERCLNFPILSLLVNEWCRFFVEIHYYMRWYNSIEFLQFIFGFQRKKVTENQNQNQKLCHPVIEQPPFTWKFHAHPQISCTMQAYLAKLSTAPRSTAKTIE